MKKPTFGICAPSSYVRRERFDPGVQKLRDLGHELVIHPQTYGRLGETQSAGTVTEKIAALYDLVENPSVDVILTACGGNFALHLLEHLDYARLAKTPKPIMGFSDTTALLNAIHHQTGIVMYHGPIVNSFGPDAFNDVAYTQMIGVLKGTLSDIHLADAQIQTPGQATGKMLGGNLEVFRALVGTPDLPDLQGAILFFEDTGLELNHLDRTLCSLKRAGLFDNASGLIFGQFTDLKDTGRPFGFTLNQIIAAHTGHLDIPVITNAPFGHNGMPLTFPLGARVTLDTRQGTPMLTLAP